MARKDIETREDIEKLIRSFYEDLLKLEGMPEVFAGIDFPSHIPSIVKFWSFVLLDESGYKTNVFQKHLHLPIRSHQFDQWLEIFTKTVDRLFEGENAGLAKQRATALAYTFKNKWELLKGKE
jgi:hemoglobin